MCTPQDSGPLLSNREGEGGEGGRGEVNTHRADERGETFETGPFCLLNGGRHIHAFICEGRNFKQRSIMTTIATSSSTTVLFFRNNEKLNKIDETDH